MANDDMQNDPKAHDQGTRHDAENRGKPGQATQDLETATRTPFHRNTRVIVGILLVLGVGWLIWRPGTPGPAIQPMPAGEQEGYRVVARRATPPSGTSLSEEFVPVEGRLRESILQRLSEFKATWRVGDPQIYLHSTDIHGDAIAFARQLEGWLEQYDLVRGPAISPDIDGEGDNASSDDRADGGEDAASGGAQVKEDPLPAPQTRGFVIRCREADSAMARDFALALLPVLGGESSIVFDERTEENRLVVSMTGSPRFGESGVAYFPAT